MTACSTTKHTVDITDNKPSIFAGEVQLLQPPVMPTGLRRTNCSMHNYRILWQQFACDTVVQFDNVVERVSGGEQSVAIPVECNFTLTAEPVYCVVGE